MVKPGGNCLILILSNSVRSQPFISKRLNKHDRSKLIVGRAFAVSYKFTLPLYLSSKAFSFLESVATNRRREVIGRIIS